MKGGKNQEGYADPTATVAVGHVVREQNEIERHESEKRAYDLIKVLKYIVWTLIILLADMYLKILI